MRRARQAGRRKAEQHMEHIWDCIVVGGGRGFLRPWNLRRGAERKFCPQRRRAAFWRKRNLWKITFGMPGRDGPRDDGAFSGARLGTGGTEIRPQRVGNVMPMGETFLGAQEARCTPRAPLFWRAACQRRPRCPGEAEFWGAAVSYCATCDGMLYRQKHVAVGAFARGAEKRNFCIPLAAR